MLLRLVRKFFTEDYTIGELYVNGNFYCYTLEDIDRGLVKEDPIDKIMAVKVKHETAIPRGTYRVAITYSEKYKDLMPLLMNVPGFTGIRIHSGNHKGHTSGCILVGKQYDLKKGMILNSASTFKSFRSLLMEANKKESIFISIEADNSVVGS